MDQFLSWVGGIAAAIIPGLGTPAAPVWSGYVEADYVYIAPVSGGQITSIPVKEGELVRKGDVLFILTTNQQQALVVAAEARVDAARANLDNLATGSRQEEVDVISANLSKAQADLGLATQNLTRSESLFKQGLISEAKLQQDRATRDSAQAGLDQLQAQLKVAGLPARNAQQQGAEANLVAAQADADRARSDLADRTVKAPEDGQVDRLFFSAGETANAGVPVASLLSAASLKVKFYVGEGERQQLRMGGAVKVACDGCAGDLAGTISYLDSQPQNTPPIIYSRDERGRLVFLVEAKLADGAGVLPGQPVTVTEPMK